MMYTKKYKTTCLECGTDGTLEVTEGTFFFNGVTLTQDGYDLLGATYVDAEDEMVYCQSCEDLRDLADYESNEEEG